jgi:uncharacterized protein with PIN domain
MGDFAQLMLFVISGIILLMVGYYLFFGPMSPIYPYLPWSKKKYSKTKSKENTQFCPVCSYRIAKGEQVKTVVFPPANEKSIDQIMHIKGCSTCLNNSDVVRRCPVCKAILSEDDFLLARMFERSYTKNHVHVLGCTKCRKV